MAGALKSGKKEALEMYPSLFLNQEWTLNFSERILPSLRIMRKRFIQIHTKIHNKYMYVHWKRNITFSMYVFTLKKKYNIQLWSDRGSNYNMATSNLLESLANVVAYAEKNLKMFLFLVFVTDYFVINNWPLLRLTPFFLVSLTFIMISLMALVYLLYQVMGESFVKADIFSQRRSGAGDGKDEKERNSSEDLPKKTSSSAHKLVRRRPNRCKID